MKLSRIGSTLIFGLLTFSPLSHAETLNDNQFVPIIEMTVARLRVAYQVALTKWDTQQPVEDLARETVVIDAAAKEALEAGVKPTEAKAFFSDQIEANKLVQYGLHAQWRRAGKAPNERRASLTGEIRPELDRLQTAFIAQMAAMQGSRLQTDCPVRLSLATQAYAAAHNLDSLYSLAVERALARFCGGPGL